MSYAVLTSTQWVTYANLQDAVNTGWLIPTGTTIPGGGSANQWIAKPTVTTYVTINTANATYAPKSTNQWVAKQDLTPVDSCGVHVDPYAGVNFICNLGTTSGTVTLTTNYSSCGDYWAVYYPATLSGTVIAGSLVNGSTFTFTYNATYGTNVLVVHLSTC